MTELVAHLRSLRAELTATMAAELAADRGIHSWLPLLAAIHAAVQAVEAVMSEREAEAGGGL